MFIVEKNSWMKDKGNLDSHSISVIYYSTRFISVASVNRVCSLTHAKGKENPRPLHPHPLSADSSATLHLIKFYRGSHPKLDGAIVRRRRSPSKRYRISPYHFPPPICTDILDSGRLGFSVGLGRGFFSWRR